MDQTGAVIATQGFLSGNSVNANSAMLGFVIAMVVMAATQLLTHHFQSRRDAKKANEERLARKRIAVAEFYVAAHRLLTDVHKQYEEQYELASLQKNTETEERSDQPDDLLIRGAEVRMKELEALEKERASRVRSASDDFRRALAFFEIEIPPKDRVPGYGSLIAEIDALNAIPISILQHEHIAPTVMGLEGALQGFLTHQGSRLAS